MYIVSYVSLRISYFDQITAAGSQFEGMGLTGLPMALVYGYIRTGLAEEIVFRVYIMRIQGRFAFMANLVQAILFDCCRGSLISDAEYICGCMYVLFAWGFSVSGMA